MGSASARDWRCHRAATDAGKGGKAIPPDFDRVLDTDEGWAKENRPYWLRDWRGYVEVFFGEMLSEPHSTKLREGRTRHTKASPAWRLDVIGAAC